MNKNFSYYCYFKNIFRRDNNIMTSIYKYIRYYILLFALATTDKLGDTYD